MKTKLVPLLLLVFLFVAVSPVMAAPAAVDVPADHWAYTAVKELARIGIIDGYSDGTFRGDKLMTRYEMAQIVEKAMDNSAKASAKQKALIDKLASEFALEINHLDARVSKIEAKTNFKIMSETWLQWTTDSPPAGMPKLKGNDQLEWRERLNLSADVSPSTTYGLRVQTAVSKFGSNLSSGNGLPSTVSNGTNTVSTSNVVGSNGSGLEIDRSYFTTQDFLGLDKIIWGRQAVQWGQGLVGYRTGKNDGVTIVKKLSDAADLQGGAYIISPETNVYYGSTASSTSSGDAKELQFLNLGWKVTPEFKINTTYYNSNISLKTTSSPWGVGYSQFHGGEIGYSYKMGDWTFIGDYARSMIAHPVNLPGHEHAYAFQITNGTNQPDKFYPLQRFFVDYNKPGTEAWSLSYRCVPNGILPSGYGPWSTTLTMSPLYVGANNLSYNGQDNLRGWDLAYEKVVTKGIVLSLTYQALKRADTSAEFTRQLQAQFIAVF
ncbi:MAG: S-layer homology domain-containing protein [Negativicutes bacterium]|nr:S-layer homology domain-containing protein [Negativicutes bacterium]